MFQYTVFVNEDILDHTYKGTALFGVIGKKIAIFVKDSSGKTNLALCDFQFHNLQIIATETDGYDFTTSRIVGDVIFVKNKKTGLEENLFDRKPMSVSKNNCIERSKLQKIADELFFK